MGRLGKRRRLLGCSEDTKKSRNRSKQLEASASFVLSLPRELVTEILARTASHSSVDFFNAKLSCRKIYEVTDDNYIYKQMSLERFPHVSWRENRKVSCFLDRCKESGNPEALFRQGVIEYFSRLKLESGLSYLKRAASSRHYGASYVLGVILLCSGENTRQEEGMRLMDKVRREKRLGESRRKLRDILWTIWVNNRNLKRKPNNCPVIDQHRKREGWPSLDVDEDDGVSCQECSCNREIIFVCNVLGLPRCT